MSDSAAAELLRNLKGLIPRYDLLLEELAVAYETGNAATWGEANPTRSTEVWSMFMRLNECLSP